MIMGKTKSLNYCLLGAMGIFIILATPLTLVADEIEWMISEWPPCIYTENGELKGYDSEMIKMIQAELPEYNHSFSPAMNTPRKEKSFKNKKNVCTFGLYKTPERAQFVYFSIPSAYFFPNVILMRKETHMELGSPKSLSLAETLKNKNLKLGIKKGRSYGKNIDNILKISKKSGNIYRGHQTDENKSIVKMLANKRFDYLIEYPDEGEYIAREIGFDTMVSVTIEEMSDLSWSCIACSKTEWGLKVTNGINKALYKLRPTKNYREAYGKALNKNLRTVYQKSYDEIFLKLDMK